MMDEYAYGFTLFMTRKLKNSLRKCAKIEGVAVRDIVHEGVREIVNLYKKRHKKEGK